MASIERSDPQDAAYLTKKVADILPDSKIIGAQRITKNLLIDASGQPTMFFKKLLEAEIKSDCLILGREPTEENLNAIYRSPKYRDAIVKTTVEFARDAIADSLAVDQEGVAVAFLVDRESPLYSYTAQKALEISVLAQNLETMKVSVHAVRELVMRGEVKQEELENMVRNVGSETAENMAKKVGDMATPEAEAEI